MFFAIQKTLFFWINIMKIVTDAVSSEFIDNKLIINIMMAINYKIKLIPLKVRRTYTLMIEI